ncbi:MAG: polysaccharide deacetylase family protein [Candidatus Omnitrophota bacterium]
MASFLGIIIFFLRDSISFIIYLFIFYKKRNGHITLLYHSVGYVASKDDPLKLNILPQVFERHLEIISRYSNKIRLTFDDGYSNIFKNAFPLIKKHNLDTIIFLVTDFIDGKVDSKIFGKENFNERPLSWEEIRLMDKSGIKFGSHSKTHLLLTKISEDELRRECIDSKKRIEEVLGHEIENFSYPFGGEGSFDKFTEAILKESKYNYAYTNIMGISPINPSSNYTLKRIRVYRGDGPLKLKMKIKGAYDWVDYLFIKLTKGVIRRKSERNKIYYLGKTNFCV